MIERNNYIHYKNTWYWGYTITLVRKDGYATVELQFDDSLPNQAVIKGLMVFTTMQRKGIGTELMNLCHMIARENGCSFLQLSVTRDKEWLVEWYERFGFTIIAQDSHEFTMIKAI